MSSRLPDSVVMPAGAGEPAAPQLPLPLARVARLLLEPAAYAGALLLVLWLFHVPPAGSHLFVATLAFLLAVPDGTRRMHMRTSASRSLWHWATVAAALFALGALTGQLGLIELRMLVAWLVLAPALAIGGNRLLDRLSAALASGGGFRRKAVIVGASTLGGRLRARWNAPDSDGLDFVGFFDDRSRGRLDLPEPAALRGPVSAVAEYVNRHHIDVIYIALPMASHPRIEELLATLKDTTASVYFVLDVFLLNAVNARLDTRHGMPMVAVCETPILGINRVIKRCEDLLFGALILLGALPLMAAIAAAIRLESPGGVLFRQRRYGLDGREIVVYKFRTMTVAEDGAAVAQATREDRRITPLGRLLRRYSLDELPQLINVLQGRMSLVGPRPHAVAHNELYRKLISGYMVRHKLPPGITGWAQVNGLRGETDTLDKMKARVEYDLAYLRQWSLGLDLLILVRTVWVVLHGRNAY